MDWWNLLVTIDNVHNYLQFLLPTLIFLTLSLFFKSRMIAILGFVISSILLLLIVLNNLQLPDLILILKTLLLILSPLVFYLITNQLHASFGNLLEYVAVFSLMIFFVTQVTYGVCIIHYYQNILAKEHLSLEIWHPVRLFGSEFISSNFLLFLYSFLSLAIFIKLFLRTCLQIILQKLNKLSKALKLAIL